MLGQVASIIEGLMYVILAVSQIGNFLVILGKVHLEDYLVQIVEPREAPPVGCELEVLIDVDCTVKDWGHLLGLCFGYIL